MLSFLFIFFRCVAQKRQLFWEQGSHPHDALSLSRGLGRLPAGSASRWLFYEGLSHCSLHHEHSYHCCHRTYWHCGPNTKVRVPTLSWIPSALRYRKAAKFSYCRLIYLEETTAGRKKWFQCQAIMQSWVQTVFLMLRRVICVKASATCHWEMPRRPVAVLRKFWSLNLVTGKPSRR